MRQPPGSRLAELEAFADRRAARDTDAPVCLVVSDDPAAPRGAAFAAATSRRLAVVRPEDGSVAEALARRRLQLPDAPPVSLTLVATPEWIARYGLEALAADVHASEGVRGFGILTAGDDAALERLCERIVLARPVTHGRGRLYWTSPEEIPVCVRDADLEARVLDAVEVEARTARPVEFVFVDGHGVEHCAMAGHLCSRSTRGSDEDRACVAGLDCVWGESPRVPVAAWRAEVVYLASCLPANFHSGVEAPRNLVTRWLDGHARAILAPLRANLRVPLVGYLAWDRLRAGLPLGAWAVELDGVVREATGSPPGTLVLFGDPEMRVFESPGMKGGESPACEVEPVGSASEPDPASRWRVRLPAGPGSVRTTCIRDAGVVRAARDRTLHVRPGRENDEDAVATWFTNDARDEVRVLLAGGGGRGERAVDLGTTSGGVGSTLALARDFVAALRVEGLLIDDDDDSDEFDAAADATYAERLQSMLDEVSVDLVAMRGRARSHPSASAAMAEFERELLTVCERAGVALLASMRPDARRGGLFLTNRYARFPGTTLVESPVADPAEPPRTCPDCGGATLRTTRYAIGWVGLTRLVEDCERCGIVRDAPASEASNAVAFEVPATLVRGRSNAIEIRGRNTKPHVELVQAIATADGLGGSRERFPTEPDVERVFVEPGETFRLRWSMTPDPRMLAHPYRIKAVLARNGLPTLVQRTRPVLPAALAARRADD